MKTMTAVLAVFTFTQLHPVLRWFDVRPSRSAPDAGQPRAACDCGPPTLYYPSGGEVRSFVDWNAPACAWQCASADGGRDCDRDAGLALKGVP